MSRPPASFVARPPAAEAWVKAPEPAPPSKPLSPYSARLTIDVTPHLRGRIKVTAFARGQTVAEMVRDLLEREYPEGGS